MKYSVITVLCLSLLFVSCNKEQEGEVAETASGDTLEVSGAKVAPYITTSIGSIKGNRDVIRPGAVLAIYTNLYLAQGNFIPTRTAELGIVALERILRGQAGVTTSETFALLKEFGAILAVDVVDTLNRSANRQEALDTYTRSLTNILLLAQRKERELVSLNEALREQRNDERTAVRDLQREINELLRNEDYEGAGGMQQSLTLAKAKLAETETRIEATADIIDPFQRLISIAERRLNAMNENRRVLIAGLKVVDVPGVQELDIIDSPGILQRRTRSREQSRVDPLGILPER